MKKLILFGTFVCMLGIGVHLSVQLIEARNTIKQLRKEVKEVEQAYERCSKSYYNKFYGGKAK